MAWAADVVGGSGAGSDDHTLRMTPQQWQAVSALDARAAALQHSLQQIRQRMPPAHIAERLPHLHADSVAAHSALALEIHAHSATREQLQLRETSLQAENAAYAKALTARQEHIRQKAQEARHLEGSLQEMEHRETQLRDELEQLQVALAEKKSSASQAMSIEMQQTEDDSKLNDETNAKGVRSSDEQELEIIKTELENWKTKVSKLEEEWMSLQQNTARWPSPVQREKDLERRLRSLTEQLVTKQAQLESLANERNALELGLERANTAGRNLIAGNGDLDYLKRNKIGRSSSGLSSAAAAFALEDSRLRSAPVRQRGAKGVSENVAQVALRMDAFSLHAGSQLRRSRLLRLLTVAYVLGLHAVVFVILSSVGLGHLHQR